MTIRNVESPLNLRMTIELFGTSNTRITSCKGSLILRNSHSNIVTDNQLKDFGAIATFDSSAITLEGCNNNTVSGNSILATNSYGISLIGSYNKVFENDISSTGLAAIKIESTSEFQSPPEFNYVYDNLITCAEVGLSFNTGAKNNYVFKNSITNCKNAIQLSSGHKNVFLGNNISGSTEYAIYLSISNDNNFYHNNFWNNTESAYENHKIYYWALENDTYYSVNNVWYNGKEGNYWDDYNGSDTNGDGIGETPYVVYENFSDQYPLTTPFNIDNVVVDFAVWTPPTSAEEPLPIEELQIIVLSPENITYTATSIPLDLILSQPTNWLGYSLDFQTNVTISGNTTLSLTQGSHSLTVYANTTQGASASSETIYFTINVPEQFPTVPVAVVSAASIGTVVVAGAFFYVKKHKREK
jgi:parallel beta-helix repeat protein